MAPEVELSRSSPRAPGQLRTIAAKNSKITPTATGAPTVTSPAPQGRCHLRRLEVAKVVQCTGVYTDPARDDQPLASGDLMAQGA